MLGTILGFVTGGKFIMGLLIVIIGYAMKKIKNDWIRKFRIPVQALFRGFGITATLGLSKWKWTAPLWNKTLEPFVVDLLDNVWYILEGIPAGIIEGLHTDNK